MKCLVTGATGTVGRLVVQGLRERGVEPRLFVRDPSRAEGDVRAGDLGRPDTLAPACAGVEVVFLLATGHELAKYDEIATHVARETGVRKIVKLSSFDVRRPGTSATGSWHAAGEAHVRASGLAWTFVQPVGFMSNALAWAPSITRESAVRASTGGGRIALIHPADIAAVSVAAMLDGHDGESLPLTGPEALTYAEMVATLGATLDRALRFEAISDDAARARLLPYLPADLANALVELWRAVREGELESVTSEVERVTRQAPRTFLQWCEENAGAFR